MAIHNSDVKLFESQRLTDGGGRVTLTFPAFSGRAAQARVLERSRTFLFHSSLPGEQRAAQGAVRE